MTEQEKVRLDELKVMGTLNRDQIEEYYALRVKSEAVVVVPEVKLTEEPMVVKPMVKEVKFKAKK